MGNITGKIEKVVISNGMGKNGKPYERYEFTIDGKKYSTFDVTIGEKFKAGDKVVMTGQQAGQYWNMDSMDLATEQEFTDEDMPEEKEPSVQLLILETLRKILAELQNGNNGK